jgi:sugar O-acyltransferase (sialic acid O-acetyltransferase NeuD family)
MRTLYLCGAGNAEGVRLALAVNRKLECWDRILLLDDDPAKLGRTILGVEVAGPLEALAMSAPSDAEVANLVARTAIRRRLARDKIQAYGLPFAGLISPGVDLSGVELTTDTILYPNAWIGPQVTLGEGSVVFMGGIVGHGSRLGPGCILAPNAVINARVQVGEGVYVGTNATVLPDVKIGPWATIGAGSVATCDVPAGATILGVPGRVMMKLSTEGAAALPPDLRRQLQTQAV